MAAFQQAPGRVHSDLESLHKTSQDRTTWVVQEACYSCGEPQSPSLSRSRHQNHGGRGWADQLVSLRDRTWFRLGIPKSLLDKLGDSVGKDGFSVQSHSTKK